MSLNTNKSFKLVLNEIKYLEHKINLISLRIRRLKRIRESKINDGFYSFHVDELGINQLNIQKKQLKKQQSILIQRIIGNEY